MKKIIFALSVLALMVGISSCVKDEIQAESNDIIVTATIEGATATTATKVDYAEGEKGLVGTWKSGDIIIGYFNATEGTKKDNKWHRCHFTCTKEEGGVGVFQRSNGDKLEVGDEVHVAFVPGTTQYSDIKDGGVGLAKTFSIASQAGTLDNVKNFAVMWASGVVESEGGQLVLKLKFKPVVSVLKMNLKAKEGQQEHSKYVCLQNVYTTIDIDFTKDNIGEAIKLGGEGNIMLNSSSTSSPNFKNAATVTAYAVVPAGEYENIAITTVNSSKELCGEPLKRSEGTEDFALEGGKLYEMTSEISVVSETPTPPTPGTDVTYTKASTITAGKTYVIAHDNNALQKNGTTVVAYSISGKVNGNTLTIPEADAASVEWTATTAVSPAKGNFDFTNGGKYASRQSSTNIIELLDTPGDRSAFTLSGSQMYNLNSSNPPQKYYLNYTGTGTGAKWQATTGGSSASITVYEKGEGQGEEPTPTTTVTFSKINNTLSAGTYIISTTDGNGLVCDFSDIINGSSFGHKTVSISGSSITGSMDSFSGYVVDIESSGSKWVIKYNGKYLKQVDGTVSFVESKSDASELGYTSGCLKDGNYTFYHSGSGSAFLFKNKNVSNLVFYKLQEN